MFFVLAVLLIQPQVHAQMGFPAEKIALIPPTNSSPASLTFFSEISLPLTPVSSVVSIRPAAVSDSTDLPLAPEPVPVKGPTLNAFLKSGKPMTVSVGQLVDEERHKDHIWMGFGIAAHSAATFDAWTTRRAITTAGAQELNPLLKPFAGNASIYSAVQVGPLVMDYVGRKMMYSKHSWVRHMWWVPQSASFASSLFCGVHNFGVHETRSGTARTQEFLHSK